MLLALHTRPQPAHGHVAFITTVLKHADARGIRLDTASFNHLLSVFPQTNTCESARPSSAADFACRFKTLSLLDAIWPRDTLQSECALLLLERMEDTATIPEARTHELLIRVRCNAHVNAIRTAPPIQIMVLWLS